MLSHHQPRHKNFSQIKLKKKNKISMIQAFSPISHTHSNKRAWRSVNPTRWTLILLQRSCLLVEMELLTRMTLQTAVMTVTCIHKLHHYPDHPDPKLHPIQTPQDHNLHKLHQITNYTITNSTAFTNSTNSTRHPDHKLHHYPTHLLQPIKVRLWTQQIVDRQHHRLCPLPTLQ